MSASLEIFGRILATLVTGAVTAAEVAAGAFVIAFAGGLALAIWRTFTRQRLVRVGIAVYVEWMRNVPALAHLFLLYFGLASAGIRFSPLAAAIVGLGLVGAAVLCDVFAAALGAIHAGQREAALSVGLTPSQSLRRVLMPQALRTSLPALSNFASQLVKDTSIASAIAAPEIMFYARNLVTSTFETTLIYLAAMLLYAAMVMPLSWAFLRVEKRLEMSR